MNFRFPLSFKLITLTTFLIGGVVLFVTWKNATLFESLSIDKEESLSLQEVNSKAISLNLLLENLLEKQSGIAGAILKNESIESIQSSLTNEIQGLKIEDRFNPEKNVEVLNIDNSNYKNVFSALAPELDKFRLQVFEGKIVILKLDHESIGVSGAYFVMGSPLTKANNEITSLTWSLIKSDRIFEILQTASTTVYMFFDSKGSILASSNQEIYKKDSVLNITAIDDLKKSQAKNEQRYSSDRAGAKWLLTSAKIKMGTSLIAQTPNDVITAPSKYMKESSYYILGMVLSMSIVIVYFFSQQITSPIEILSHFAKEVGEGNLEIKARDRIKSRDEVGDLALSFDTMVTGLNERKKMQNVLYKFHGSSITKEILSSEIELKGTSKDVTIFFSDIRGFTDFSEGHTAEEVVLMLNEYFEVMVSIITKNGGVVDKFIGDAIMAVWGVPHKTDSDAENAVRACLEMRIALSELNDKRISKSLSPIKIGIGLHSGIVVSGTVGSSERMEYTVIGDNVNTASRIEAATKNFGTDFLISEEVFNRTIGKFVTLVAGNVEVQGKTAPLKLYKVSGFINENGIPVIINTAYSSFEASKDKKVKMA